MAERHQIDADVQREGRMGAGQQCRGDQPVDAVGALEADVIDASDVIDAGLCRESDAVASALIERRSREDPESEPGHRIDPQGGGEVLTVCGPRSEEAQPTREYGP